MNNERRVSRSESSIEAVGLYFHSLCARSGLKAVALATEDGSLVAGAGKGDVEYMGAVGASSRLSTLEFDGHPLHVRRLEVNAVPMCLAMAGQDIEEAVGAVRRILSA